MATAGFFYVQGDVDTVQCFHCGIKIFDWEPFDEPLAEHLRLSRNCTFAKLISSISKAKLHFDGEGAGTRLHEGETRRNPQTGQIYLMPEPEDTVDVGSEDEEHYLLVDLLLSIVEHTLL